MSGNERVTFRSKLVEATYPAFSVADPPGKLRMRSPSFLSANSYSDITLYLICADCVRL
jgi:hypothetical protein